jgi:hypothetical protein
MRLISGLLLVILLPVPVFSFDCQESPESFEIMLDGPFVQKIYQFKSTGIGPVAFGKVRLRELDSANGKTIRMEVDFMVSGEETKDRYFYTSLAVRDNSGNLIASQDVIQSDGRPHYENEFKIAPYYRKAKSNRLVLMLPAVSESNISSIRLSVTESTPTPQLP